jgi:hypothetical protein
MRGVGTSIKEASGCLYALVGPLGQLVNLLGAGRAGVPAVAPTLLTLQLTAPGVQQSGPELQIMSMRLRMTSLAQSAALLSID